MASRIRIAIDCMGGDSGLHVTLPAAFRALLAYPDLELFLVGPKSTLESELDANNLYSLSPQTITIVDAPDSVLMSDKPASVLRHKRHSSMYVAVQLLKDKKINAVVSAGNTGALMAVGCYLLGTLTGIDRPAICARIPTHHGNANLLDLGANVNCSAKQLHQFAVMGAALSESVDGVRSPRLALLNIGEEQIKGNEQVKQAARLLGDDSRVNFIGSIEGDKIFSGDADVIVCDGFVGNVALKTSEGTARYISSLIKFEFMNGFLGRLVAFVAKPVLKRVFYKLDPQQYNGASFLGLQGVVVKSHGSSNVDGFLRAISQARSEVKINLPAIIEDHMAS
jgi:glycerol-3-phosphate acyltransferase PlsX